MSNPAEELVHAIAGLKDATERLTAKYGGAPVQSVLRDLTQSLTSKYGSVTSTPAFVPRQAFEQQVIKDFVDRLSTKYGNNATAPFTGRTAETADAGPDGADFRTSEPADPSWKRRTKAPAHPVRSWRELIGQRLLGGKGSNRRIVASGLKHLSTGNAKRGLALMRKGGRGMAKRLGLGKTGQALGGRLAMAGGSLAVFGTAAIAATKALDKFAAETLRANFEYSHASPSMAMIEAQRNLREFFRDQRIGEKVAPSARYAANAEQDARDAEERFDVAWQRLKNNASGLWSNVKKEFLDNSVGAGIGGTIGAFVGGPGGALAGASIGAVTEDLGRQSTDWVGKHLWGYSSEYYERQNNRGQINKDLQEAIEKGDKEQIAKLQEIIDKLDDAKPGETDLSGWIIEGVERAAGKRQEVDERVRAMEEGGMRRAPPSGPWRGRYPGGHQR